MNFRYYYNNHHLYQYYCIYRDILFKTREDYLNYCNENNINLKEVSYSCKSKYALEWEMVPPSGKVKTTLAADSYTRLFDERDISHFYFETEEEAQKFLTFYKEGDASFALEAMFKGYEGEPDYSPEAISEKALKEVNLISFDSEKEFKNVAHYIISYLPNDPVVRQARKEAHLQQIKSIKAVTPYARIYIVAQNYKEEDYIQDPQITYYSYELLGAMKARNTALKHFYESNYDWCILNDDDTVLLPTESAKEFARELEYNSYKFEDVDIIWGRDMYHMPFQRNEIKKVDTYVHKWVLNYALHRVWHYTVIRNFKKYYNKEEYQDETIDPTLGMGYDDADFCYYLHTQGYQIFDCSNAFRFYSLNWVGLENSVVYTQNTNPWVRLNNKENTHKRWFYDSEKQKWLSEIDFRTKCNRIYLGKEIQRDVIRPYKEVLTEFKQRDAEIFIDQWLTILEKKG